MLPYQFSPGASKQNGFCWLMDDRPSIFMEGTAFRSMKGRSTSEIASEAVKAMTKKNGRSPGSLTGISEKADRQIWKGLIK